jgi:hypothetical protein
MIMRGPNFSFEMNLDVEIARVSKLQSQVADARETVLSALGVQVVSWAVQDYRARSEGRSAGGISWAPITASAIRTRLAGRTPWQRDRESLKALRGVDTPQAKKTRQRIRDKRKATIAKELGKAKIGIDTGRLVNSLVYGVPALSSVKVGTRPTVTAGLTQGVFSIEGDSLRVGSVMKYAGYFDEKRPIFPAGFIDAARQQQLDTLGEKAVESFIARGAK